MELRDVPRQLVIGATSAIAFLVAYFGLTLVWWIALILALLIYCAMLLLIRRKPASTEVMVAPQLSQADLHTVGHLMDEAATRLTNASGKVPEQEKAGILDMVGHVQSIRVQILDDPSDFRQARRFIISYLPNMVETVERYADLAAKSRGRHPERLASLANDIHGFRPALEKLDTACMENDFRTLEAQVSALSAQMKRG